MATSAEIQTKLDNANAAMEKLILGQRVEEIMGPDGVKVKYQVSSLPALREYIGMLEGQLRRANNTSGLKPVHFTF